MSCSAKRWPGPHWRAWLWPLSGWRWSTEDERARMNEAELIRSRELKVAKGRGFWVFGYGSLMWRPGFDYLEARPALLRGYHRAFCVESTHYRGTPECPGLVLGLDRGGACRGRVF